MKVLIASPIDSHAIRTLQERHDVVCARTTKESELFELIEDREVLVFRSGVSISRELMANAPELRLLIRAGSGIDNIDLDYAAERGFRFERIPEPGAKAVAEMAFALMLALARRLHDADRLTRAGRWAKHDLPGYLLTGKILGVVGAGNIGSQVGRLGVAWGMEVRGCVETLTPAIAAKLRQTGIQPVEFREVLESADFLSIHVPLQASTRNLIGEAQLRLMKPGAFLINLARGGVVDELALRLALVNGHLRGAALDVHAQEGDGKISPLADLPNVILTPHLGAMTVDSQREIGERVIRLVNSFSDTFLQTSIAATANTQPSVLSGESGI